MQKLNYQEHNNTPPAYVHSVATPHNFDLLSAQEQDELILLLEAQAADGLDNISLYGWQKRFNKATATHRQCLLMAANRVGKTYTGCYIDAIHATGRYPDDWEGYRFDHPPLIWLLGYSGEKCRDILQAAIFGAYSNGSFSGGLISTDYIVSATSGGVPKLASEVRVKWVGPNGEEGVSVVQIKSYSQGQHALMGDGIDYYHIDEEPKDPKIWPQVLTRTATGDRGNGGRGILTFTPENGRTELVVQFMDNIGEGQYLQTATWADAPHIKPDIQRELLSAWHSSQHAMRTKGVPLMGEGLVFDRISEESIKIEPFQIPQYWFVINGMDFGWNHPQAHIQLVWDRDADTFYVTNAWKESKKQPFEAWHIIKPWAADIPTAWPADGLQTEKGSAKQQKSYYEDEGWYMLGEPASWEDGGNGVWAGIMELSNAMETGRFKVFSNLFDVFHEIQHYHTRSVKDGRSKIVKKVDDLIDAIRYAYMMRRHAIRICDINPVEQYGIQQRTGRDTITGY